MIKTKTSTLANLKSGDKLQKNNREERKQGKEFSRSYLPQWQGDCKGTGKLARTQNFQVRSKKYIALA
jgi:hypothetical protein